MTNGWARKPEITTSVDPEPFNRGQVLVLAEWR